MKDRLSNTVLELEKVTESTHLTDVEIETQRVVVAFLVSKTPGSSSPLRTIVWVPGSAHSVVRLPPFLLPLAFLEGNSPFHRPSGPIFVQANRLS